MANHYIETDVLIIGCGIAGGTAALQLAEAGIPVAVVTRAKNFNEANTYYAQGGIIYKAPEDSPERLVEDVMQAGAGLSYKKAVRILARQGPELVKQILIDRLEIEFDKNPDGTLSLAREGGHSLSRIIHAADATGKAIEEALVNALKSNPNVTLLSGYTAVDLLTPSHHARNRLAVYEPESCVGAYLFDQTKQQVIRCLAKNTILATGGLGQIFLRTTNPAGARGDGLAMATRAGARVINMEFIQFHPTTFYHKHAPRFLISEAVRGAGARLVDEKGEPLMERYDPNWKDLAPRDVVSRSIHQEMLEKDVPNVYLDLRSYMAPESIREHFPTIYETLLEYNIDITRDLIPVVPAAHYSCGGIWTDEFGQTTIDRLYAVGEVACTGIHGANRLASTSLLEGLVWGYRSAIHISQRIVRMPGVGADEIPAWIDTGVENPDPALVSQDMNSIKQIMWNYVGLVRTTPRLERALRELRHLETEIEHFYHVTRLNDNLIGLRNAALTALLVATAAWKNKSSIGCHYRE